MRDELPTIVVIDDETQEKTETLRFYAEERAYVERLISIIHRLRKRDNVDAKQIHSIAILLRALERLPMISHSVSITISLINEESNGSWGYFSFSIGGDQLELAVGEVINCGVGHDHQVLNNLIIGLGWRTHDEIETRWDEWLDEFAFRADDETFKISIEDDDSDIDWYAGASGAEFWKLLPENVYF